MFAEILSLNLYVYLTVVARITGAMMFLPGFSSENISTNIRALLSLAIGLVIMPSVAHLVPPLPASPIALGLILLGEILYGSVIGLIAKIIVGALQTTGTVISFTSAMANAMATDPISQQQSAVVGTFITTAAMTMLFVTDMHHLMISAVVDSYTLFIPGSSPMTGDLAALVTKHVAGAFELGVKLAAPFIVISFAFNLALGITSKLMPQLQVYFVGLPLGIVIAFGTLMICIGAIVMLFVRYFETSLETFLAP